ncbi:chemotaxis protein CheB [Deinococcus navajonensis]|uniref:protein-glutamate methylesterase n=1 Tax=Deinococcus navajonensis TaxID=309884 RepID=A0ABV8XMN1_9DEIO
MFSDRLVVIGSSAGGIESLLKLVAGLPQDFPAPILVAQHTPAQHHSVLPQLLRRAGPLPAAHAQHGEPLVPGRVYVAPPDHHLLVEKNRLAVTRGPKENRFRPSVDALFRSAAYEVGPAAVGVVLSGLLDDGTSGLWTIKRRGGTAVVQAPEDALFPEMPQSALQQVEVDHVVAVEQMAPLLTQLVQANETGVDQLSEQDHQRLAAEVQASIGSPLSNGAWRQLGELSSLACPDCHGVLVKFAEGGQLRYRCHSGHAFTNSVLLPLILQGAEDSLWNAVRAMEEAELLLGQLAEHAVSGGEPQRAEGLMDQARAAARHAEQVRGLLMSPILSERGAAVK